MKEIKVIPTKYNGFSFRSRLEARWAVFFDHLKIPFEYEKEGYILTGGSWYLPDFWLPDQDCWFEVKPTGEDSGEMNASSLGTATNKRAFVAFGQMPYTDLTGEYIHLLSPGWDSPYLWCQCPKCGKYGIEYDGRAARICGQRCFPGVDKEYNFETPLILEAYSIARSFQFKRGAK